MTCSTTTKTLALYQDGLLPSEEAHHVENHVQTCETCQLRLKELASMEQGLNDLGMAERLRTKTIEAAKRQSIQAKLNPEKERWFAFSPLQWAPVAAVLLLVVITASQWMNQDGAFDVLQEVGSASVSYVNTMMNVDVGDESYLKLRMGDERSIVEFAPKTNATVLDKRSLSIAQGKIYNQVAPDPENPYTVVTPHAEITVLGTEFEVDVGDDTIVRVNEGSVRVKLLNSTQVQTTILKAGYWGEITNNQLREPQKVDTGAIASWRNQYVPNQELKPKNIADILKQQ